MVCGRPLHVHADVAGAGFGHDPPHRVVRPVGSHVVDDARPGGQRGAGDAGLMVSIEIGTRTRAASCSITGSTRRNSSASATGKAPGRVDSPPTSRISAPCSTSCNAWATAARASRNCPAVQERVGGHVHDAHDQGGAREGELELTRAQASNPDETALVSSRALVSCPSLDQLDLVSLGRINEGNAAAVGVHVRTVGVLSGPGAPGAGRIPPGCPPRRPGASGPAAPARARRPGKQHSSISSSLPGVLRNTNSEPRADLCRRTSSNPSTSW